MIDWSHVRQLYEDVGAEDFDEVIELFVEEVTEVLARLDGAPDRSNLEVEMHFLKGCALSLGFVDMSQLCSNSERSCANGHPETVDLAAVTLCYTKSKQDFFARYRQELTA